MFGNSARIARCFYAFVGTLGVLLLLGVPVAAVLAQAGGPGPSPSPTPAPQSGIPYWGPLLSCTGNYFNVVSTTAITNTCNDFCDLLHTAQNITNFTITIVLFIGVPAMIAFGGILIMVAGGSPEKRKSALNVILSAFIGAVIVLGAFVILNTFLWLSGNDRPNAGIKVSWPEIKCDLPPPPTSS